MNDKYFKNTKSITIRNCTFAYKCNMDFEDLEETDDKKIGFCRECQKEVHYCRTDEELADAIRRNKCVSIDTPFEKGYMLGMPDVRNK